MVCVVGAVKRGQGHAGAIDAAGKGMHWGGPGADAGPLMPFQDSELPLSAMKWSECLLLAQP